MNKTDLIQKIKQLEGISQDERAYLINLVNTKKKYGLVWEDKPEDVEEQLRTQLPVLREVVEKRITASPSPSEGGEQKKAAQNPQQLLFEPENIEKSDSSSLPFGEGRGGASAPNHILIEGDNLHALTALTFTHEGQIDVMYFDPPYNTGNKDFKYNDTFVDKEDSYRHSKWLSFMDKRLRIAKRLLSNKGVIFISIDDNEQAQLKILCDEVFYEFNLVGNITVVNNLKGRSDEKYIATAHEYVLIYKNGDFATNGVIAPDDYIADYKLTDNKGKYRLLGLRKRGDSSLREDRPNLFYPIYYDQFTNKWSLDENEIQNPSIIIPKLSNGKEGNWRWGRETLLKRKDEIVIQIVKKRNEFDVYQKDYLHNSDEEIKRIKPKSFWSGTEFSTDAGTKALKEVLPEAFFRSPKPIGLINYCLLQGSKKESTILDIFAGSGTTLHATMQLNADDGGNRQCILVTNNENNICEEVTYERNRRVIQGYTNSKGEWVSGLTNNNLRYYKSEFVGREPSLKNKRELTRLATELLCIKEDCYDEKTVDFVFTNKSDSKNIRFFEENDKRMLVVYDDSAIETSVEMIKSIISNNRVPKDGIKVYVFSPGQYPFTEEFEEVLPFITLCALPDAIYKAFLNVLPKKKRQSIPELEEDAIDSQPELFD